MTKTKAYIVLFIIFVFAYLLRVWFLKDGALTFGYDQARDAIISQQILKGDFKILGPSSSAPGLYHGVFYYYLLAPFYLIGNGSPIFTAYMVAMLNSLTILIVFYLTYLISKKSLGISLLASFLFALSFEQTQYATWLSNPTIGVWSVPLMYLGLWIWTNSENKNINWGPFITALGLGISIQAEIFLLYHLVPLVIWLYISRKNINKKGIIIFLVTLLTVLSSMIISEVKFGFKGIAGIKSLISSQEPNLAYAKSLGDYFVLYLNQIGRIFSFNSIPSNIGYGGAFVILLIFVNLFSKLKSPDKNYQHSWQVFLAIWLLSHLSVVTVGGVSTPFLMVGIGPAVSIIIAMSIGTLWSKNMKLLVILILSVMCYSNLSSIVRENSKGSTLFSIQKDMVLSKQLGAIDYTYKNAEGDKFTINSLTSPLWINIVWSYLYKWYGMPKYGYLPEWHGKDQVGQLDSLSNKSSIIKKSYLIIEPMDGIPTRYLDETIGEEDSISKLLKEENWGQIRVQEREIYAKKQ